jgi:hypothetical protein
MPSDVRKLDVLIASPGDTTVERDAVERALHEWNDHRGDAENAVLRPRRYEISSVPISGRGDAQTVINRQVVDKADIVIGIFYSRLGTPTERASSGTVEELNRSVAAGKPVHLYFSDKKLPKDVDTDQLAALRLFRTKMQRSSLVSTFRSVADLQRQVLKAIEYDISHMAHSSSIVGMTSRRPRSASSQLAVVYKSAGYANMGGAIDVPERIEITNVGINPVEQIFMTLHRFGRANLEPQVELLPEQSIWRFIPSSQRSPMDTLAPINATLEIRWVSLGRKYSHVYRITSAGS